MRSIVVALALLSVPALAVAQEVVDPMEKLREKLAARLAAVKPEHEPGLLQVSPRAPSAGVPRRAVPAARPDLCITGKRQSPIDLRDGIAVDLEPLVFDYGPSPLTIVDDGRTVAAKVAPGHTLTVGGRRWTLKHLQFRRPAEERIDGRQFEMGVHLVHEDAQGRIAIVAVVLEQGAEQPVVQAVWNDLPLEKHHEVASRAPVDLAQLLPAERRYYTYMGSLTTPPCTEGVLWVVLKQPLSVSPAQSAIFARLYPDNARAIQPLEGRRIKQSR